MSDNFMKLINDNMKSFSKGQKLIAKYIMEYYDKAAFMTASKLGKAVDVSESTVVRFASQLGFDGYPGMQKAIQNMVRSKLTSLQRIKASDDQIGRHGVLGAVLQSDIDKIRFTLEHIDHNAFERVVDALLSARNIIILGSRSSATLACFMGFYFKYLFENVWVLQSDAGGEVFEQLMRVREDDVVLAFSFPRYSTSTVQAVEFCIRKKAKIVLLTDSPASPLYEKADIVLQAQSNMISFVDSLVAPLSVINAIIVAVSRKEGDNLLSDRFLQLEKIWEEYKVYDTNS